MRNISPVNLFLSNYVVSGILIQSWKLTEKVGVVKVQKTAEGPGLDARRK